MSDNHQDNLPIDPVIRGALRARQVPASDSCVDAETLAAWFEGGLDAAHVAAVDAHLADCLRCQSILAALTESSSASAEPAAAPATSAVVVPFEKPSKWRWVAPVAAGLAAAGIIFWMVKPAEQMPTLATQLAEQSTPIQQPTPTPTPAAVAAPEQAVASSSVKPAPGGALRAEAPARPAPAPLPMAGGVAPTTTQPTSTVTLGAAPPPPVAQTKPSPLAVPPPAPPPTVTADSALARADRNTMKFEPTAAKKFPIEFGPPSPQGLGRGGGGGGRAAGSAGSVAALRNTPNVPTTIRWRILESGRVERSLNSGETWSPVTLEAAVFITAGSSPAPATCWLVGREGAVFRSIDGATFARVVFPIVLDLESVTAQSADRATVSTRDGRTFTTTDGGHTWSSN